MSTMRQADELLEKLDKFILYTKEKFSQDGKALVKRRQTLDYDDFEDDLRKVAVIEVIEMEKGELTIFCSCYTSKSVNGCKGDLCVHVCAKLIQQEIIPRIQNLSKSVASLFI
jgi:hypothetical protein